MPRLNRNNRTGESGFSLLELMIVVVIVSILAAVAYPLYTNQIQKGNRAQAKTRMTQAAQLLERFYSDNSSYCMDASSTTPVKAVAVACPSTAAGFAALMFVPSGTVVYSGSNNEGSSPYIITLTNVNATFTTANQNAYTLTATPQGSQIKDTTCKILSLTNTGIRAFTGSGTLQQCW